MIGQTISHYRINVSFHTDVDSYQVAMVYAGLGDNDARAREQEKRLGDWNF